MKDKPKLTEDELTRFILDKSTGTSKPFDDFTEARTLARKMLAADTAFRVLNFIHSAPGCFPRLCETCQSQIRAALHLADTGAEVSK